MTEQERYDQELRPMLIALGGVEAARHTDGLGRYVVVWTFRQSALRVYAEVPAPWHLREKIMLGATFSRDNDLNDVRDRLTALIEMWKEPSDE